MPESAEGTKDVRRVLGMLCKTVGSERKGVKRLGLLRQSRLAGDTEKMGAAFAFKHVRL